MRVQNGTTTAHGKTWPMYETPAYYVEVKGQIDADTLKDAKTLEVQLNALLAQYRVEVTLVRTSVIAMSEEDQAEKNALDEAAVSRYYGKTFVNV